MILLQSIGVSGEKKKRWALKVWDQTIRGGRGKSVYGEGFLMSAYHQL